MSEVQEVAEHHRAAVARGAQCLRCPLYNCGQGPVTPEIRPGAKLTVVGDAPGTSEVEAGRSFVGNSGSMLEEGLAEGGLKRHDLTLTNAVLCRPPGGDMVAYLVELKRAHAKKVEQAKANKKAIPEYVTPAECCAPRLATDVRESGSKVLLGVGGEGLKALANVMDLPYGHAKAAPGKPKVATIKKQHGSPVLAPDGRILMASLHPAFTLGSGGATYGPVVKADLRRAAEMARRGHIAWQEPEFILKPSADVVIAVIDKMLAAGALVTVDVETDSKYVHLAKLRCVGIGAVVEGQEVVMVVPLRYMTGQPWWDPATQVRVENALRTLMETVPLAGHNLAYDTAVMLRQGLMVNRAKQWFDCYLDSETEFLTQRGWLKYDDVQPSDKLATVAPDNRLEWQHYTHRVDKQRDGFLYEVETQHTRAVVTPGHTIWHAPRKRTVKGLGAFEGGWRLTPAEDLVKASTDTSHILRACVPEADDRHTKRIDGVSWTPEFTKLMGLAICDASVRHHRGKPYRLRISQKQGGRAYSFLREQREALGLREFQYTRDDSWRKTPCVETVWEWRTEARETAERFVRWFGRRSVERRLPEFVFTMPPTLRRALLDGLLLGDASEVGPATLYRSYSKALADGVQALALTLGISATLHRSGKCFVVNLRPNISNEVAVVTREAQSKNGVFTRRKAANYRVVCFVVPNHTLVTRSGGRPAFFGNTMIGHHDTDQSELPHDLGFVAARHFEAPRWKEDADAKTVNGVDDYWLHLYCAKDVLGEMRLVLPIAATINDKGTIDAFRTDLELAPVCRDMGELGLNLDEKKRRESFEILDAAVNKEVMTLRSITGDPSFNPNAFKQVSKYLYITKGLSPPYATDGREWADLKSEDDDDDDDLNIDITDPEVILAKAATNELSLLRLLELGVDKHTQTFIEAQLRYRGLQKCKATYVGMKRDEDGRVIDVHRERGYLVTENWGPGLEQLSILHASWKLHITPTGRFATSPNVQNWPERVVYDVPLYQRTEALRAEESLRLKKPTTPEAGILNTRAMVVAPPGHILVGADYAAIELRLYAVMAQDKLLLDAILNGKDPHALNYATMMARTPAELMKWYEKVMSAPPNVKKYLRIIAKRFGFLVIYGGQEEKLYQTMAADRNPDGTRSFPDLKPSDVTMWFSNWHRGHPETRRWHEAVVRGWTHHGFVATLIDGRKRFFLGGIDQTAMPNMTIQGTAAAIANRALKRIAKECPHRGWSVLSGPVLQVHDFIGLQVPVPRQQDAEALLNSAMPYSVNGMPITIEGKSAFSWDKT